MHTNNNKITQTALALACMFGHRDVVLELLKHGADPDQPSSGDDWTPMVHASRCCHHEIVQDLLETFEYKNLNQIPSIDKITLNCGLKFNNFNYKRI